MKGARSLSLSFSHFATALKESGLNSYAYKHFPDCSGQKVL